MRIVSKQIQIFLQHPTSCSSKLNRNVFASDVGAASSRKSLFKGMECNVLSDLVADEKRPESLNAVAEGFF